jgi:hypothetical protein
MRGWERTLDDSQALTKGDRVPIQFEPSMTRYGFVRSVPFAALLIPLAGAAGLIPLARFDSEQITIHVFPEHVIVDGLYYYRSGGAFAGFEGDPIPYDNGASEIRPSATGA